MSAHDAEIRAIIERLLPGAQVAISRNGFGDVTVIATSAEFAGLASDQREELLAPVMADPYVDRIFLLAPDDDVPDIEVVEPLWPESLARGAVGGAIPTFPTDLDAEVTTPVVCTFYSLRGGVGRSTALAFTARELASRGHRVVVVDMDFEAPGLAALFGVEDQVSSGPGLPGMLLDLERGDDVDILDSLLRIDDAIELYLLPAGRAGAEYARVLSLLSPDLWYREEPNPLAALLDGLGNLPIEPTVILIDSRTGLSPLSAPLLFDVADLAVVGFFPHPQASEGTEALTRALLAARTRRSRGSRALAPEPRFLISPIPSGSPTVIRQYQVRALDWITDWLEEVNASRQEGAQLLAEELAHFVAYNEQLAASDMVGSSADARSAYRGLADWIEALVPSENESDGLVVAPSTSKPELLAAIQFSAGTSETQDRFAESFVHTDTMRRALDPEVPLVLGRKGTGKTAVFRRLLEVSDIPVVVTAPSALAGSAPLPLTAETFEALDGGGDGSWRSTWMALICLSLWVRREDRALDGVPIEFAGAVAPLVGDLRELTVVTAVRQLLAVPDAGLLLSHWLGHNASTGGMLLFDGLDTGFGSTTPQRERRRRAIDALLPLALERSRGADGVSFKILLRDDIWRTLSFQNKSHYFGRSVTLEWQDQIDYLRTAVRQATLTPQFVNLVERNGIDTTRPLERWPESDVLLAWNELVGERMKGGKTTFTRNWVWNRLADANGDHSPRALLQLFYSARRWEMREEQDSPYDRSIMRPRALAESLPAVSGEALEALREEFSELDPLVEELRRVGRTPLDASELESVASSIDLAREVGLLEVYEGNEDAARRYRVPDLFRMGLGMSRMGQV